MSVVASFASVLLVSLVSFLGLLTISLTAVQVRRLAKPFVSFAAGALLGDAFIHLIPEIFSGARQALHGSLLILGGMVLFFAVEKLLRGNHHDLFGEHHPVTRPELAGINVIGDGVHNFIDGALIAGSYLVDVRLGVSTTIAVLLHEIPQELGDFSILVHSGLTPKHAVLLNAVSAGAAFAGAAITLGLGKIAEGVTAVLLPLAAGGFVYLAAADLIPEMQHERGAKASVLQILLLSSGIGLMALLALSP